MTAQARISRRAASWILIAIVSLAALAFGTIDDNGPRTNADRVFDISQTILCPQCVGQSVAESDVAIAREIRADIASRVDAGETDEAIRQVYVDRYGEDILLTPPSSGLGGLVWVIPVVAVVAGGIVVAMAMIARPQSASQEASDQDRALVAKARKAR